MNYHSKHDIPRSFPQSPYKPIVTALGTIATIQAIAITIGFIVIAIRDGACYM